MAASRQLLFYLALLAPCAARGDHVEALTPGWDSFPPLASGSVTWNIAPGSRTFDARYVLDGSGANQQRTVGFHHMDARQRILFGGGTTGIGNSKPDPITREGNSSAVIDTTFGFLTTDANGDADQSFQFQNVNAGVYGVQLHGREGGAPGCPATNCNAMFRSGGVFAGALVRFAVPGPLAFWTGDGDLLDRAGGVDATASGTIAYRDGHFRKGFDLASGVYLQVPSPVANGLGPADGFTVAAWIVQDGFSNTASIINLRTAANASGFTLEPYFNAPGTMLFAVNTTGIAEGFATLSPGSFPFDQPVFIAASFDAASHTMRVFRDGVIVAERTDVPNAGMSLLGTEQLRIGSNVTNGAAFDGLIDEVLYFDRALSPADVLALYGNDLFKDGFE